MFANFLQEIDNSIFDEGIAPSWAINVVVGLAKEGAGAKLAIVFDF